MHSMTRLYFQFTTAQMHRSLVQSQCFASSFAESVSSCRTKDSNPLLCGHSWHLVHLGISAIKTLSCFCLYLTRHASVIWIVADGYDIYISAVWNDG